MSNDKEPEEEDFLCNGHKRNAQARWEIHQEGSIRHIQQRKGRASKEMQRSTMGKNSVLLFKALSKPCFVLCI